MYVPLRRARRGADGDEREQVLRSVEGKPGDHKVEFESPAVRGEPAQLRRELVHGECPPVLREIRHDAVRELRHRRAGDVDLVVRGPSEVPPGVSVRTQGCHPFGRAGAAQ